MIYKQLESLHSVFVQTAERCQWRHNVSNVQPDSGEPLCILTLHNLTTISGHATSFTNGPRV